MPDGEDLSPSADTLTRKTNVSSNDSRDDRSEPSDGVRSQDEGTLRGLIYKRFQDMPRSTRQTLLISALARAYIWKSDQSHGTDWGPANGSLCFASLVNRLNADSPPPEYWQKSIVAGSAAVLAGLKAYKIVTLVSQRGFAPSDVVEAGLILVDLADASKLLMLSAAQLRNEALESSRSEAPTGSTG